MGKTIHKIDLSFIKGCIMCVIKVTMLNNQNHVSDIINCEIFLRHVVVVIKQ